MADKIERLTKKLDAISLDMMRRDIAFRDKWKNGARPHIDEDFPRYGFGHTLEAFRAAREELFWAMAIKAGGPTRKLINALRRPDRNEARELVMDMLAKIAEHKRLRDLGVRFCLASEIVEADVAAYTACRMYYGALWRNGNARSFLDCRAPSYRVSQPDYVDTGRFEIIDGESLPVLERV